MLVPRTATSKFSQGGCLGLKQFGSHGHREWLSLELPTPQTASSPTVVTGLLAVQGVNDSRENNSWRPCRVPPPMSSGARLVALERRSCNSHPPNPAQPQSGGLSKIYSIIRVRCGTSGGEGGGTVHPNPCGGECAHTFQLPQTVDGLGPVRDS